LAVLLILPERCVQVSKELFYDFLVAANAFFSLSTRFFIRQILSVLL